MRFGVLGPIGLWHGPDAVPLGRRKQRALLAVLLTAHRSPVSLDRLVDLLWDDEPPSQAVVSLQAYVSNLRRLIEPDRPARAPATRLVSHPPGYALLAEPGEVDASEFTAALAAARAAWAAGDLGRAERLLDDGLALWRGPAYGEFATEPFAIAEAVRLDELRRQAIEDRLDVRLAGGRHADVAADAEAFVTEHPLRERACELLMVALYRCGRQADALRSFQRTRTALVDELGLEPGPSLRDLEQRILDHDPELRIDSRATPVRADALDVGAPPSSVLDWSGGSDEQLVGRDAELTILQRALDRARQGAGAIVVVSGEAGVGKSALAGALADAAAAAGVTVATGRSPETRDAPALWPWMQVLRRLGVPDTAALADTEHDHLAPAARRAWIVARILDAAEASPLLVVLDDLQWADGPSQHVLRLLADEIDDEPILVVATRRVPADEDPALAETSTHLARVPSAQRLPLRPLDALDGAELVRRVAGDVPDALAADVQQRAGGNPFFVVELARLVGAEGPRSLGRVPATVNDVVLRRLAVLPEQAVAVITIASVVGPRLDPSVLADITGLDPDALFDLLELATMVGVLVDDDVSGGVRFAHDLLRTAIEATLPPRRRARVHADVASALTKRYADSPTHVHAIARHAVRAIAVTGPAAAVDHVITSARAAQWALDLDTAAEQYEVAVDLVAGQPDVDAVFHARLLVARSQIGFLVGGRSQRVDAGFREAMDLAASLGDAHEMAIVFAWASFAVLWGDFDGVAAGAEQIRRATAVDPAERTSALAYVDGLRAVAHDPRGSHRALEASIVPTAFGVGTAIRTGLLALVDVLVDRPDDARRRAPAAVRAAARPSESWRAVGGLSTPPPAGPWVAAWTGCFASAAMVLVADDGDEVRRLVAEAKSAGAGIRISDLVFATCDHLADALDGDGDALRRAAESRGALAGADDGLFGVALAIAELRCRRRQGVGAEGLAEEIGVEIARTGQVSWANILDGLR